MVNSIGETSFAMTNESVLVTGATGFIGRHLVERLLTAGCRVSVLARDPRRVPDGWSTHGVTVHHGDITDPRAVVSAIDVAAPRMVFHLASTSFNPPTTDPAEHVAVICGGAANVLAAIAGSPTRVVHAGSGFEYGAGSRLREDQPLEPATVLGAAKAGASLLMQAFARAAKVSTVVLRLFTPYGPGERGSRLVPSAVRAALRGEDVRISDGRQRRDFVYVDDVVEAMLVAARHPLPAGATFNVCSGTGTSIREVADLVVELSGRGGRVVTGALPTRSDEIWELTGDNAAARRDLGWQPTVGLREGLRRSIAWLAEHPDPLPA